MKRVRWVLGIFLILGLASPGLGESPTEAPLVQLRDVTVEPGRDGSSVRLRTTGQARYEHGLIDTPYRVVIDLEGTTYGWRKTPLKLRIDPLRQIRGSQYRKGVTRVVLELSRKAAYTIDEGPEGLTVKFEPAPAPRAKREPGKIEPAKAPPKVAKAEAPKPPAKPEPPKPEVKPQEQAVVKAEAPKPPAKPEPPKPEAKPQPQAVAKAETPKPPVKPEPPKPEVKPQPQTVAKAEAPKAVVKPETPKAEAPAAEALKRVEPIAPEPKKEGAKPVVTAEPPAAVPLRVAQAPRAEAQAPSSPTGQRLISLDFKDADVINLLRILAAESGKNIVLGDDVKGKISISLRNVTWELALETILEVRGLQKLEKENVIRIVSTEQLAKDREAKAKVEEAKIRAEADIRAKIAEAELREQEVQQRKLAAAAAVAEAQARGPLREETIRLSYADPDETVKTLIGILGIPPEGVKVEAVPLTGPPPIAEQPFAALYGPGAQPPPPRPVSPSAEVLAKGITIRAHKPTNSIFIRHYAADLERIKKLIKEQLDVPLPQVKIEARMESMVREALQEIGVQWGGAGVVTTDKATLVGSGFTQPPGPGTAAQGPGGPNPNLTLGSVLPVDPNTGLSTGGNVVNLPVTLGSPAGGITFGIIGSRVNINLAIQALETQGKTRNLASPKVVTVENNKATMALGEEIPYATISSAGTQIQFKEATRKLEVTPTVVKEGDINRIKMKVVVEDNVRGATVNLGGAGNPPAIDKRKVETEVLVKEGETLVIGGVGIRRTVESLAQVPLLGRIPLLGWLFKRRGASDRDEELVVFITPSVVKTDQPKPAQSQGDKPKGP